MHSSERYVDNNPRSLDGWMGSLAPQSTKGTPRTGMEQLKIWGDGVFRQIVPHSDSRNLELLRGLYHPNYNLFYQYPKNPDTTESYYHDAVRKYDVTETKTLRGNVRSMDLERWDDVTVTETWAGGSRILSMMMEFFETLHLFTVTRPSIGRYVGWCPFDMGYNRHLIQPIAIRMGGINVSIREIRSKLNTGLDAYSNESIQFSFKLIRQPILAGSLMTAEGL